MGEEPDYAYDVMETEDNGENVDTFDEHALDESRSPRDEFRISPRKFRNNSYYKAVGSSLDSTSFKRHRAIRKKADDEGVLARALLYQEVTERGLGDDMDDEEDEVSNGKPVSPSSNQSSQDSRPLWANLPQVRTSGILLTISSMERKRQEAMYELFLSEQSYLRSLNVLVEVFMSSNAIRQSATSTDYHHLFSNVQDVRKCCKKFLDDLQKRYGSGPEAVNDICDIIHFHIKEGLFLPYVTYCSNEVYQQRAFNRLISENPEFVTAMKSAEADPNCMGLPLHSFLLLPMQRVTRLPLLIDMICQRCEILSPYRKSASEALRNSSRLVKECNERAKSLSRTEDMITLQSQLEFKTRSFALVSQSRYLLKRGQLTKVNDDTVLGFKKLTKQDCHVFLFNDVLITAKKKSDDKFTVADFCYRHRLKVFETIEENNSFLVIMERNQDGQRVTFRLQAESPSSCARWVSSLKTATRKEMKVHEACVQVRVVRPYRSDEPDLITLQPADILFVLQATADGWYFGEKIVDGRRGWFPSSYAKEVLNEKAREANFKRGTRMHGLETEI